ncbi:mannose-6-phosphate isomerase, class I [Halobacillus kuroshimensis]|uniref:mannose-6-phosphate isomerase, class I n=1 Tax=Halobacillus kuroshimensis TaxID=302481 RepID=UPI0003F6FE83|nr:mannose-6-phosphate isomerase, class I [Halobacillus kuroshimensis]
MYTDIIRLSPIFKEKVWGGSSLHTNFDYDIPSDHTGECWGIASHPSGSSTITNGPLTGWTLMDAWKEHKKELFNEDNDEKAFPLLIKILDANDDLSVQVHPNDAQAHELEDNEAYGKTECWYIVDCKDGSEIVLGHHAKTRAELEDYIEKGDWDGLLRRVPVKPGDFFFVPAGTIHAIGEGIVILETQQNSDTTYRVYDYDRRDDQNQTRELHLNKAVEVTTIPDEKQENAFSYQNVHDLSITTLTENDFFSVFHLDLDGIYEGSRPADYLLATIIEGEVTFTGKDTHLLKKGDHFILPYELENFKLEGTAKAIVSYPK